MFNRRTHTQMLFVEIMRWSRKTQIECIHTVCSHSLNFPLHFCSVQVFFFSQSFGSYMWRWIDVAWLSLKAFNIHQKKYSTKGTISRACVCWCARAKSIIESGENFEQNENIKCRHKNTLIHVCCWFWLFGWYRMINTRFLSFSLLSLFFVPFALFLIWNE